jgi:hypothetical protein
VSLKQELSAGRLDSGTFSIFIPLAFLGTASFDSATGRT